MATPVSVFRHVGLVGVGASCFAAGLFAGVLATRMKPSRPAVANELSLESLKSKGAFLVRTRGATLSSFPSGIPCVYFEWVVGDRQGDEWSNRYLLRHSDHDVELETPDGTVTVRARTLRLYIASHRQRTYTRGSADVPDAVRELLADHASLQTEEFALDPSREYFATVDVETARLPPGSGAAAPRMRQNLVLTLSDLPLVERRPQRPPTPASADVRY